MMATVATVGIILADNILVIKHPGAENNTFFAKGYINVELAEDFRKFMSTKTKGDEVIIRIESPGGALIALDKMLHYMNASKAKVTCIVDSYASSAAANLFIACPNLEITLDAQLMFHVARIVDCTDSTMASCTLVGVTSPTFEPAMYNKSIKYLEPFDNIFTKDEITAIMKGENVTITGHQVMKRSTNGLNQ